MNADTSNLSEKISHVKGGYDKIDWEIIGIGDVKSSIQEFLKDLRKDVATSGYYNEDIRKRFVFSIYKLALKHFGKELVEDQKHE